MFFTLQFSILQTRIHHSRFLGDFFFSQFSIIETYESQLAHSCMSCVIDCFKSSYCNIMPFMIRLNFKILYNFNKNECTITAHYGGLHSSNSAIHVTKSDGSLLLLLLIINCSLFINNSVLYCKINTLQNDTH